MPRGAEVVAALGDGVVEQLLVGLAALPHPHHVVAPVQAVEGLVELGHTGAGRFISHASKHKANRKPRNTHRMAAVGPATDPLPRPAAAVAVQHCCPYFGKLVHLPYLYRKSEPAWRYAGRVARVRSFS